MMVDTLTTIPLIDLVDGGPVELFEMRRENAKTLLAAGNSSVPSLILGPLDSLSRRWLHRARTPYSGEIDAIANGMEAGTWFVNLSMEWGCTSGVAADPENSGSRILRTLDWPVTGLGREVVVARMAGNAGEFYNVTWPGFVGALTVMAPGRFSAAINQAPIVRHGMLPPSLNWGINRLKSLASKAIPPTHLLRQVCETCNDYEQAKEILCDTPIAIPALFALSGMNAIEGCVIERLENRSFVHEAPSAIANHWLSNSLRGKARGIDSHRRHRLMNGLCRIAKGGFDWLIEPLLNVDTCLAVVMNAAQGTLLVRGFEPEGLATEVFDLSALERSIEQPGLSAIC
jgi:hypothetical protein